MGLRSPCAQRDPAPPVPGSAVSLCQGARCSYPFPSLPAILADRPEALGAGERCRPGHFCGWINLVVVRCGVTHCIGLCMFPWKGAEFAALLSLPVAARVDTHAHTCPSVLTSVGGS